MGAIVTNATLPGGRQGKSLNDKVLADAAAQLADAPDKALYVADDPVAKSKGVAGSTGYAYREALRARGIGTNSVTRTVEELRTALGDSTPDALKNAPGKSFAWVLVRNRNVKPKDTENQPEQDDAAS